MPSWDDQKTGIVDFPPDPFCYSKYLDKVNAHSRAPTYKIRSSNSESMLVVRTAAADYEPGQYKIDRNFVENPRSEVRAGILANYASPKRYTFEQTSRLDEQGVMRGIRNPGPGQYWFNPTGPGQYEADVDGIAQPVRSCAPSMPSYSVRKGEPQENVRLKRGQANNPGPGYYEAPRSRFDMIREANERKAAAKKPTRRPVCRCEGQFKTIFRSISAKPSVPAGKQPLHATT